MKNKMTHPVQARQGDVLLVPVKTIPTSLKKTTDRTLALGEATGHHHTFDGGATCYAEEPTALADFVNVADGESATLAHQEHAPIEFAPGVYEHVRQYNYTPAALQRVAD